MPAAGEGDAFMARHQLYGGFGGFPRDPLPRTVPKAASTSFFVRSQRQRLNVVPICQCLLLPWGLFCLTYAAMSFRMHYAKPALCAALVALGLALTLISGGVACAGLVRKAVSASADDAPRQPSWLLFLSITSLAAWILGVVLGHLNFWTNMQPYYDYANLNDYTGVDPARTRGQQLMDAGRVNFTEDAVLDLRRSMGFRNLDMYCVAPVTVRSPSTGTLMPLESYDFWAVGLGCCEGSSADFRCGDYNIPQAHQGLRLLRDDQRPFFRLAVQQAEATYSIKATHPLFFYWARDAGAEMDTFRNEGYKYYLVGMLVHFTWQTLCVLLAVAAFAKLGHY